MPSIRLFIISLAITCILFGLLLIQLKAQLIRHEKALNFLTSTHINRIKFIEYIPEPPDCPVKIVSVNNDNKQINIVMLFVSCVSHFSSTGLSDRNTEDHVIVNLRQKSDLGNRIHKKQ